MPWLDHFVEEVNSIHEGATYRKKLRIFGTIYFRSEKDFKTRFVLVFRSGTKRKQLWLAKVLLFRACVGRDNIGKDLVLIQYAECSLPIVDWSTLGCVFPQWSTDNEVDQTV